MSDREEWQERAERALTALWGTPITATITKTFRDEGRNRVFRMAIAGGPVDSVILKASVGDEQPERFANEWAGCAVLGPLGLGPVAYTGEVEHRFYIMEDLGEGTSLADCLMGTDPAAAEAALDAYARSLGELHAATRGQEATWERLRQERGGSPSSEPRSRDGRHAIAEFVGLCQSQGISLPSGWDDERERIVAAVDNPGAYLAFTPADCCPDNHYLRGDRVIFFDCEGAQLRHALLDAAYLLTPFPTCWCLNRLPKGTPERLLALYREHFPGGPDFDEQLLLLQTLWTMTTISWGKERWQEEDSTWGLATVRQRHLFRLENLLARPSLVVLLPAVAQVAQELHGILKARWTDLEPMPLYPAFRGVT